MPHLLIPAHQLRIGDLVRSECNNGGRRIAGCRIQGARPEVVIIWADNHHHTTCPAANLIYIYRPADE